MNANAFVTAYAYICNSKLV